jgi:hypothetical protein
MNDEILHFPKLGEHNNWIQSKGLTPPIVFHTVCGDIVPIYQMQFNNNTTCVVCKLLMLKQMADKV